MISKEQMQRLLETAKAYRDRAYAPYSGFAVGAALLGASGKVYGGCNVENASYPATRCAEQTAVQKAVSEGERQFAAIAVIADGEDVPAPCGVCRQVLSEFGSSVWVIMGNLRGKVETARLDALLPRAFTRDNL